MAFGMAVSLVHLWVAQTVHFLVAQMATWSAGEMGMLQGRDSVAEMGPLPAESWAGSLVAAKAVWLVGSLDMLTAANLAY